VKGSNAVWGGWEPRICSICGERITLSGKRERAAFFGFDAASGVGRSWHMDCRAAERKPCRGSGAERLADDLAALLTGNPFGLSCNELARRIRRRRGDVLGSAPVGPPL
jgi:hypothetical protein